jgi:hypothetical protein
MTRSKRRTTIPPTDPGPRVAALVPDLITASKIESAVRAAGGTFVRCDTFGELPDPETVDLLVVDWGSRRNAWAADIITWRAPAIGAPPRIVVFGPHTDLEAHAAAKAAGLGPMRARSAVFHDVASFLTDWPTDS